MLTSIIRTLVPIIVGWLLSLPLAQSLGLDEGSATQLVTAVVTAVYYVVARLLERFVSARFGWLLGRAAEPTYAVDA